MFASVNSHISDTTFSVEPDPSPPTDDRCGRGATDDEPNRISGFARSLSYQEFNFAGGEDGAVPKTPQNIGIPKEEEGGDDGAVTINSEYTVTVDNGGNEREIIGKRRRSRGFRRSRGGRVNQNRHHDGKEEVDESSDGEDQDDEISDGKDQEEETLDEETYAETCEEEEDRAFDKTLKESDRESVDEASILDSAGYNICLHCTGASVVSASMKSGLRATESSPAGPHRTSSEPYATDSPPVGPHRTAYEPCATESFPAGPHLTASEPCAAELSPIGPHRTASDWARDPVRETDAEVDKHKLVHVTVTALSLSGLSVENKKQKFKKNKQKKTVAETSESGDDDVVAVLSFSQKNTPSQRKIYTHVASLPLVREPVVPARQGKKREWARLLATWPAEKNAARPAPAVEKRSTNLSGIAPADNELVSSMSFSRLVGVTRYHSESTAAEGDTDSVKSVMDSKPSHLPRVNSNGSCNEENNGSVEWAYDPVLYEVRVCIVRRSSSEVLPVGAARMIITGVDKDVEMTVPLAVEYGRSLEDLDQRQQKFASDGERGRRDESVCFAGRSDEAYRLEPNSTLRIRFQVQSVPAQELSAAYPPPRGSMAQRRERYRPTGQSGRLSKALKNRHDTHRKREEQLASMKSSHQVASIYQFVSPPVDKRKSKDGAKNGRRGHSLKSIRNLIALPKNLKSKSGLEGGENNGNPQGSDRSDTAGVGDSSMEFSEIKNANIAATAVNDRDIIYGGGKIRKEGEEAKKEGMYNALNTAEACTGATEAVFAAGNVAVLSSNDTNGGRKSSTMPGFAEKALTADDSASKCSTIDATVKVRSAKSRPERGHGAGIDCKDAAPTQCYRPPCEGESEIGDCGTTEFTRTVNCVVPDSPCRGEREQFVGAVSTMVATGRFDAQEDKGGASDRARVVTPTKGDYCSGLPGFNDGIYYRLGDCTCGYPTDDQEGRNGCGGGSDGARVVTPTKEGCCSVGLCCRVGDRICGYPTDDQEERTGFEEGGTEISAEEEGIEVEEEGYLQLTDSGGVRFEVNCEDDYRNDSFALPVSKERYEKVRLIRRYWKKISGKRGHKKNAPRDISVKEDLVTYFDGNGCEIISNFSCGKPHSCNMLDSSKADVFSTKTGSF